MPRLPSKTPAKKAAPKKTPAKKTAAAKKTTARTAAVTKRDRDVVEHRGKGLTFEAIARKMRFRDVTAVHAAYERGLTKTLPETPTQRRRAELERIRTTEEKLWPKAEAGDLAAIEQLVDLAVERAMLSTDPLPTDTKRVLGPIETATFKEAQRLEHVAPALAATALALAKEADETTDPGPLATVSRELRMHMSQLRGLAGTGIPEKPPGDGGTAPNGKSNVVPETRLEQLRREARERELGTS